MSEVDVWVSIDGQDVVAGKLYAHRRRGTQSATFAYSTGYLARPGAYALDPALPMVGGSHQTSAGRALFGAFGDCAPDRWGRTLVQRREAALAREQGRAPRSRSEFDYLLGVRDDLRQGALRFRHGDEPFLAVHDAGVPALTELAALLDLADRAEADTADLPELQHLMAVGSSLGGARPKVHVRDVNGRLAIAKFPSAAHDTWNVMAWEKVTLDLAAAAGLDTPRSHLLRIAGRSVLVVHRFDRTEATRESAASRIGYVSAMTMLEAADGDRGSYLGIAETIEMVSSRATQDLHQLWRRMVFSVLVSNTDDHLRNHGFLHDHDAAWRLSPAFDLNPNPEPGPKFLSTAIDEGDDTARLTLCLSVADYFRLSAPEATSIIEQIRAAVGRWPQVARSHGLTPSEIDAMAWAFTAHDQQD